MKKLSMWVASALLASTLVANAGINVQWFVGWGIYPFGAGDPSSLTPGTGLLANNGSGTTILQLIWSPGNTAAAVDPFNGGSGWVGGDNVVLQTRTVTSGVDGYDEWVFNNTVPTPFTNPVFSPGSVFVRVFQDATPGIGEYYYDSGLMVLQDRDLDFAFRQILVVEPNADVEGIALNLQIVPEPSVIAFLGLGGLMLAIRRRIRNA